MSKFRILMGIKALIVVMTLVLMGCGSDSHDGGKMASHSGGTMHGKNPASTSVPEGRMEAYRLMQQRCFSCHSERPTPERHQQMLAPPMSRVQEHYKPNFNDKASFVNAIVEWLDHPLESRSLMPGAIRKFNIMPAMGYKEVEVRAIAELLYEMDFGSNPKRAGKSMGKLTLNQGGKWKVKPEHWYLMEDLKIKLNRFNSSKVEDYNQLGKDLFSEIKRVLLDPSYKGELLDQLHVFFNGLEGEMHALMQEKDLGKAKQELSSFINKLDAFKDYFKY